MRRSLILRLVDVTLLLLLTLMAAATIRPADVDLPTSVEIDDEGSLKAPLKIAVGADGLFRPLGTDIAASPSDLPHILKQAGAHVEFYVAHDAEAHLVRMAFRAAQAADVRAVFLVRRIYRKP